VVHKKFIDDREAALRRAGRIELKVGTVPADDVNAGASPCHRRSRCGRAALTGPIGSLEPLGEVFGSMPSSDASDAAFPGHLPRTDVEQLPAALARSSVSSALSPSREGVGAFPGIVAARALGRITGADVRS